MDDFLKKNVLSVALVMLITPLFLFFNYELVRSNTTTLIITYFLIFIATTFLILSTENKRFLFLVGLVFRCFILFSIPNLSQDFYRFIWDGRMLAKGLNPYLYLPEHLINDPCFQLSQSQELYNGMGGLSAGNFTNYPPINQFVFWLAAVVSNHSILGAVLVFKIVIILSDIGIYVFSKKILAHFNLNPKLIFWYFLNPLVLIELTGNLHFEGFMLFFLVYSFYILIKGNWAIAAVLLGLSISVKLLPLMLLPLYLQHLGLKKSVLFSTIAVGLNMLLFLPFLSAELLESYSSSVGLWFTKFEFNASIYYLIREVGFWIKGYNIIQTTGKVFPFLMIGFILIVTFFRKNKSVPRLLTAMLLILSIYFFQSTTVHPWYVINLVLLAVFTGYAFPIVWSLFVILSYSAYGKSGFQENYWLIGLEYLLVYGFFLWEFFSKGKLSDFTNWRNIVLINQD